MSYYGVGTARHHHHPTEGIPPPPSLPGMMSHQSFQGPTDEYWAAGYVEQWRRSKMQRVWKPVRLVLSKSDMVLWVQREHHQQHYGGGQGDMETLLRIPLSLVRSVGLVDDYMGERRFSLLVPDQVEDPQVMFRCDEPAAATKWITTLKTVQERLSSQPPRTPVAAPTPSPAPRSQRVTPPVPAPPPPQDLLSFHVVTPAAAARPPPPPPPKPLGPADFDPFNARSGSASPSSAPSALRGGYNNVTTTPQQHRPPAPPHSGGTPPPHAAWRQHHPSMPPPPPPSNPLRQAVLNQWALAPPHRRELRNLDQLLTTIQTTFDLLPPHARHVYFGTWTPLSYHDDLCSHHVLDADKSDRAVRRVKAFLHPDKWPTDPPLAPDARALCQLLWEIVQHAQERQSAATCRITPAARR